MRKLWRTFLVSSLILFVSGSALGQATADPKTAPAKEASWEALNSQSDSLYREGKLPEAEAVLKRAVAAGEKEFGPESWKVAYSLSLLASTCFNEEKYAEAEPLFQRALAITEKNLGPQDSFVAFLLDGLGSLYTAEGKYAEAEASFQRALTVAKGALAAGDARIARIQTHYAALLRKTERVAEADALDARTRSILGPSAGGASTEARDGGFAPDQLAEIEALSAYDKGDYAGAARMFRELATRGNAFAQSVLGGLYMKGQGVARDPVEAVAWLKKAAAQGQVLAEVNLGASYESGLGVRKDTAEAVRWYRKAAEQGFPGAQRYLGDMYARGKGVSKDWKEAERWYRKAAEQGDPGAQRFLGDMYANGFGVAKDRKEAERWYAKAAAGGDEKATSLVAVPYSMREGTPKSLMALGMRAVELQDSIFLVRWVIGHPSTLTLSGEEVTAENAPQVLERLERERASVDAQIEISGSRPVAGDYALEKPAKKACTTFGGRPLHYPLKATVLQAKNGIEIHGEGLVGCGLIVGNLIVMKDQECAGTSPGRLLAVAIDGAIKDLTLYEDIYGNPRDTGCSLGTLTRVEAPK